MTLGRWLAVLCAVALGATTPAIGQYTTDTAMQSSVLTQTRKIDGKGQAHDREGTRVLARLLREMAQGRIVRSLPARNRPAALIRQA